MFYRRDSMDVKSIACLLGCQVDSGLVNDMNRAREEGYFVSCTTVGQLYTNYLKFKVFEDSQDRVQAPMKCEV